MPEFFRDHIQLQERTTPLPYTSVTQGRSKVKARTGIDRVAQGTLIRDQFTSAVEDFSQTAPNEDFVYIVFRSARGFLLDIGKFEDARHNFRLASYRKITGEEDAYEATVYLNRSAVSKFLRKVEQYINENTIAGNPKHQCLIANLDAIRVATLQSFWQEPELPFPNNQEECWWEVWVNRDLNIASEDQLNSLFQSLEVADIEIGRSRWLAFPEHLIFLVKGTAEQLAATILYSDSLSELRKPRDTAEYFTYLDKQEQADWIADLVNRIDLNTDQSEIAVCLLDTGVNRDHPLLIGVIPNENMDAIEPHWDRQDTHIQGHGTPMAGLAIYGDLTDVLATNHRIQIYHHFESVKIIEHTQPNKPELYGAITQEAVARGDVMNPGYKRLVCMAVTSDSLVHLGRPSSWSAAIDQVGFGYLDERNESTLFFISSGNLPLLERINFPVVNDDKSIEDPAQAFNAITVGAYTLKDQIDLQQFPNADLVSQRGGMAPCNSTSVTWQQEWPRKPDIVMEGGNHGIFNQGLIDPDSLQLLSSGKGGLGRPWLTSFGDTSAATALASKFAAELYFFYPNYWPETIRGLMIHAADWTPAMLGGHRINELSGDQKSKLITTVGYGVPNMQKARFSASNSLSLIIERTLKPYKFEERVKTDEFHLVDLPWPVEALQNMLATPVQLKVTLSYFIEPNPGNKQYELAASYRSHGLRFKMIDTNESEDAFAARISKEARDEDYIAEGGEHWILGNQIRDKGSLHKDIWEGTAADLATRNKIAVYPVGGWWKSRKQLKRFEYSISYSLIVTIDTPDNGIDIYTPVQIQVLIDV